MESSFRIAEQIGQKGFYADVKLNCDILSEPKLHVSLGGELTRWKTCMEFACSYVWEHFISNNRQGLKITILEVKDNPVDTTDIVIVYVIVKALELILDLRQPSLVDFDKNAGTFSFSK